MINNSNQSTARSWKCALYLRLSKEDGDKAESDSISNQRELITNYLKSFSDIEIVTERVDDGFSGVDFERPSFTKMMDELRAGQINCVAVKDLSRFGRNFTEAGKYLEQIFPFLGVRFISANDQIDSMGVKSYSDSIIMPFKNLINDAYSRDISIKIRSHLEIKRKKGEFVGTFAAYGYLKDEKNHNKIVPDEYAADIVRDIFKWKIEGMSHQGIALRLNDMGVLSPLEYKRSIGLNFKTPFKINTKAVWSAVAVGRILKDEIYTGTLAQGKQTTPNHKVKKGKYRPKEEWVRALGTHEPIITKEDFGLADTLLSKDMRIPAGNETVYMFSGITRCADCGENMVRQTVNDGEKKYFYYICKNSKIKKCKTHSINEKLLSESVFSTLKIHIGNIINLERILAFIDTLPLKSTDIQKIDRQLVKIGEEMKRYKELKLSLYESMQNGLIDKGEYKEYMESYSIKYDEAEKASFKLREEIETILINTDDRHIWIEQFKEYQNITELTRRIIVSLIDEILIHEGSKINIRFKYQYSYESALDFTKSVIGQVPSDVYGEMEVV